MVILNPYLGEICFEASLGPLFSLSPFGIISEKEYKIPRVKDLSSLCAPF